MAMDGMEKTESKSSEESNNFIADIIREDIAPGGQYEGMTVHTRFPPEPNGYLHIGHAKAICIDFGLAEQFGGICNLRMDDTNPSKEDTEYVDSIKEDIKWLGYDWGERFHYASDYFDKMYEYATDLIKKGLAYVCDLSAEDTRKMRGTLTEAGENSPYRERSVEENLRLFEGMKNGLYEDGSRTLRAKIDMSSGNMNMRDPVIYRIMRSNHHRTGDQWCIYPMYDFAHPIEDALEHITHSLCSIEFEDHRPLYNWFRDNLDLPSKPTQIEFARLGINYTVMSKRKLRTLVEEGLVDGWDDPRMPTLSGLRRRGYTPDSIKNFISRIGVSKVPGTVDSAFLDFCLREDLNKRAPRRMAVIDPVKLVITNYPEGKTEEFEADNNPEDEHAGKRKISFSRELWIERDDFMENPPRKYFRLYPGNEVRLKHAYIVKCTGFKNDENGRLLEVYAEYDPESRGGNPSDGRRIKGTIHFVDTLTAVSAEIHLFDRLFNAEEPDTSEKDFHELINPDSMQVISDAKLEASLSKAENGVNYQFIRKGYFIRDAKLSTESSPVFIRSVTLKDSFKLPKSK